MDLSTRPLTPSELEALKTRLRALGKSHTAAAEVIGVSAETLLNALRGQRKADEED